MSHLQTGAPVIRAQDINEDPNSSGTLLAGCRTRAWFLFTDGYPDGCVEEDGEAVGVWASFRIAGPDKEAAAIRAAILEKLRG